MTNISLSPPIVKGLNTVEEPKVGTAIKAVEEFLNGHNIDGVTNIKTEGIEEKNLNTPLKEKLSAVLTGVKIKSVTESTTAATGELILAGKAGITITLPARVENREVVVFNTAANCKVKTNGGFFVGDFITIVSSTNEIELLTGQHITVQCDANNWYIKAGESRRTQAYTTKAYTKVEAETGEIPSPTRPASVTLINTTEGGNMAVTVGGVGIVSAAVEFAPVSFRVMPNVRWKATRPVTAATLLE